MLRDPPESSRRRRARRPGSASGVLATRFWVRAGGLWGRRDETLRGRMAVVTGASSAGIGPRVALDLAERGAVVIGVARRPRCSDRWQLICNDHRRRAAR